MRLLAAAATLAALLVASPAFAQSGLGMSTPPARSELSQLTPTHRYWETCLTGAGDEAVRACGRVIGARVSRLHTATAHYFRSIALTSVGRDERALRDLRRAYFSYVDLLFEEEGNALARYGRGLSLIRLGREAEGEEDLTRASETSQGRAGEFFEISS